MRPEDLTKPVAVSSQGGQRLKRSLQVTYADVPSHHDLMERQVWDTARFRGLCGILTNATPWPEDLTVVCKNVITGELFWNLYFEHDVIFEDNIALFDVVTNTVLLELRVSAQ